MPWVALGILACLLPAAASAAPLFTGLGDLAGGSVESRATAVSADGRIVVGWSDSGQREAFRWELGGSMVGLGNLLGASGTSQANDISADGSTIVGSTSATGGGRAFRWDASNGMSGLARLGSSSAATGVSGDGSVIVGTGFTGGTRAARWVGAGAPEDLFPAQQSGPPISAAGVSDDGNVVVGYHGPADDAFRWEGGSSIFLPTNDVRGAATAASADGSVIVGSNSSDLDSEAVLWQGTPIPSVTGLGLFPGGEVSLAHDVSADGRFVVGRSDGAGPTRAFLWDSEKGLRDLGVLLSAAGLDLSGWRLSVATGVADDGRTIVGWGRNPDGDIEAWLAVVPEPATGLLVGLGLVGLAAMRATRPALHR